MDSNISSAINVIKQEINKLQDEQNAALKSAAYLGMTPSIAKQCDERRLQITELAQKLMDLQRTAQSTETPKLPDEVAASEANGAVPKPTEPLEN